MALLDDILSWSKFALKPWQQDAIRRLFQKVELTAADVDELYGMLRHSHGVPGAVALAAVPFASEHIPATASVGSVVTLKALKDLQAVNRITSEQPLRFEPAGLTVVYGGNGTGKSGYSRVLKKACRARDQEDDVLTDASDPKQLAAVPQATFQLEIGGHDRDIPWRLGQAAPDELASVAVFDSRCARIYVTDEQAAAYLPYGLDVLEALANKVLPALTTKLSQEIAGINIDSDPFNPLRGDTTVGRMVASLSAQTDPNDVNVLATLLPEQLARLEELTNILKESDPATKAKDIRNQSLRVQGQVDRLARVLIWVSDEAVGKLAGYDQAVAQAGEVERQAAEALRAGESLLPGTGEPVWKELFRAAARYSTEVSYHGHVFPHTEAGARCVLCQQELADGGARLKRFQDFLTQDAAKIVEERRAALQKAHEKIQQANLDAGFDKAMKDELRGLDATLVPEVETFIGSILERRNQMLNATKTHDWAAVPALGSDPRQRLSSLVIARSVAADELEKAHDPAKRAGLEREMAEIDARKRLSVQVLSVLALIDRLKAKASLEKCRQDLNTKGISTKAKELASEAVSKALQSALNDELRALRFTSIRTKLEEKTTKGKTTYRIVLDLPPGPKRLDKILSEGEQRVIAIASFLAELRLANHNGAVIFDDPVSSLDHQFREAVAVRLVREAESRQVVILTHDTTFLADLRHALDVRNKTLTVDSQRGPVPFLAQHLEWSGAKSGNVQEGLPWAHKSYRERLERQKQEHRRMAAMPWPQYPNDDEEQRMRRQYSFLRGTIERVVQDLVLCGVVQRYNSYVNVGLLAKVVGLTAAEQVELNRLWHRCADITEAHDPASSRNAPVPSADDLGQDMAALEAVIDVIQKRRSPRGGAVASA
jgi:ABC-type lipoprotein export system ATPase subunit